MNIIVTKENAYKGLTKHQKDSIKAKERERNKKEPYVPLPQGSSIAYNPTNSDKEFYKGKRGPNNRKAIEDSLRD